MTTKFVNTGVSISGVVVPAGDTMVVLSGGTTSATNVSSAGSEIVTSGGKTYQTVVNSGGSQTVSAGGVATGTINGWDQIILSGGVSFGTKIISGGIQHVMLGGSAEYTTVYKGGEQHLANGSISRKTMITEGASQAIYSGGVSYETVNAWDQYVSEGGTAISSTIVQHGIQYVDSGGISDITTIQDGGLQTITSGGQANQSNIHSGGQQQISSGGVAEYTRVSGGGVQLISGGGVSYSTVVTSGGNQIVEIGAMSKNATIEYSGLITIYDGSIVDGLVLQNGGRIDFQDIPYIFHSSMQFNNKNGILTILDINNNRIIDISGDYAGSIFGISADVNDGSTILTVDAAPCYAQGTRILTKRGEVAIEHIGEGDCVVVPTDTGERRVRWVGHRRVFILNHPRPWDVQPVLVCAHAFGQGQPHSDLRLSPDHAVFVRSVLIPIRYLLNGATIIQETVPSVTYFHIELEDEEAWPVHDVVLAQGLPAESYLDTGNRAAFSNVGPAIMAHPIFASKLWGKGCAPLVLDGPIVASVRAELQLRAIMLGHALSTDPKLHLIVDGSLIAPQQEAADYRFVIPPGARSIRLVSRIYVPAEVRSDSTDTRRLGVAVTRLTLDDETLPLDAFRLADGWWAWEEGWRWTTGNTALNLPGGRVLAVTIANFGCYWISPRDHGSRNDVPPACSMESYANSHESLPMRPISHSD